jgi:hypothetical protein
MKASDRRRCSYCRLGGDLRLHYVIALDDGGSPIDCQNQVWVCTACLRRGELRLAPPMRRSQAW